MGDKTILSKITEYKRKLSKLEKERDKIIHGLVLKWWPELINGYLPEPNMEILRPKFELERGTLRIHIGYTYINCNFLRVLSRIRQFKCLYGKDWKTYILEFSLTPEQDTEAKNNLNCTTLV